MSNFEHFFSEYEDKHNCSPEKYECFEAGAVSRQAEVDEYKLVAETLDDLYVKEIVKNKKLQKRIDDTLKHLETHLFCELPKTIKILKGE